MEHPESSNRPTSGLDAEEHVLDCKYCEHQSDYASRFDCCDSHGNLLHCVATEYVLEKARMHQEFPQCTIPNGTTDGFVAVKADLDLSKPAGVGVVFNLNFGMAASSVELV